MFGKFISRSSPTTASMFKILRVEPRWMIVVVVGNFASTSGVGLI